MVKGTQVQLAGKGRRQFQIHNGPPRITLQRLIRQFPLFHIPGLSPQSDIQAAFSAEMLGIPFLQTGRPGQVLQRQASGVQVFAQFRDACRQLRGNQMDAVRKGPPLRFSLFRHSCFCLKAFHGSGRAAFKRPFADFFHAVRQLHLVHLRAGKGGFPYGPQPRRKLHRSVPLPEPGSGKGLFRNFFQPRRKCALFSAVPGKRFLAQFRSDAGSACTAV